VYEPPRPLTVNVRGHPSFKKEGKILIYNVITFSSSSEEEYPDRSVRGRWWAFKTTPKDFICFSEFSPYNYYQNQIPDESRCIN
jgi:hypothetical protein